MTQTSLARKLGEEVGWVNDRVRGKVQIKADELPGIAKVLGVSPCDFFEDSHPAIHQTGVTLGQAFKTSLGARFYRLPPHEQRVIELASDIVGTIIDQAG